jgi:hypothetical protein
MPQRPTSDDAAPGRIETGALDDGRNPVRQYAAAALGWAATIGVVLYLAVGATAPAVRVSLFLGTMCVLVALLGVVVAVEVFRRPLIAGRAGSLPAPVVHEEVDALGRAVEVPPSDALAGELTITTSDGVRRYEEAEP